MSRTDPEPTMEGAGDKKVLVLPEEWKNTIRVAAIVFTFIFYCMEIVASLNKYLKRKENTSGLTSVRSVGERTTVARTNSLQRKCSQEILLEWIHLRDMQGNKTYAYSSSREALDSVVVSASFAVHGKHSARIVLKDKDSRKTVARVTEAVRRIKARAERSTKFRFLFKTLIKFLDDLEKSTATSVAHFLEILANDMLKRPDYWYFDFVHMRLRSESQSVSQNVYETTLATLALFFQEGAGLEAFFLKSGWLEPDRSYRGALTLLMYCAVQGCSPTSSNEINVTEFSGTERILLSHSKEKFVRYVSLSTVKSDKLFKDKMMWDITLNCCNEFVESSWSEDCLERAVWTLQHGRPHITMEMYERLRQLTDRRKLDLTSISPVCLMAFSLAGMVRFYGRNDCAYRITEDPSAKIELHGALPMPTVQDLVSLDVIRPVRGSSFVVKALPGSETCFKGLPVGDRIHIVQSTKPEPFSAQLTQYVC